MSETVGTTALPGWLSEDGVVDFEAAIEAIEASSGGPSGPRGDVAPSSTLLAPIVGQRIAAGLQVYKVEISVVDTRTGKLLRHGEVHVCNRSTEAVASPVVVRPGEPFADVVLTLIEEKGATRIDYALMVSSEPGPHGIPTLSCHTNLATLVQSHGDGTWRYRSASAHPSVGVDIVATKVKR